MSLNLDRVFAMDAVQTMVGIGAALGKPDAALLDAAAARAEEVPYLLKLVAAAEKEREILAQANGGR